MIAKTLPCALLAILSGCASAAVDNPRADGAAAIRSASPRPQERLGEVLGKLNDVTVMRYEGAIRGVREDGRPVYSIDVPSNAYPFMPQGRAVLVAPSGTTEDGHTKLVVDVFDLRSGARLARTDWSTDAWDFGVGADPSGRWVGIREGLELARIDLTTGVTERARSPFSGLDYGTGANTGFAFTENGGLMCTRQHGLDHVVLGPAVAPGRDLLCFIEQTESAPAPGSATLGVAHLVSVPLSPKARVVQPVLGKHARVTPWAISEDRAVVAYVDVAPRPGGCTYSLAVAEAESKQPRFRVELYASKLAPGAGPWSLDVAIDERAVRVSGVDGTDVGASEVFGGAFDLRTGAKLE